MDYIYARVSTEEQDTQNQVAELRSKYPYARITEETKSSRKIRPKLVELLEVLEKGDRLIVWKLDRISRSMLELQEICNDLHTRGITLISTTQNVDMSTPMGKMFIAVLGMIAEMERENISERTKLGIKRKKAVAKATGQLWKRPSKHRKGGRVAAYRSPHMAARLAELKAMGYSWERITEKLAYENIEWKVSPTTATRIYAKMNARRLNRKTSKKP